MRFSSGRMITPLMVTSAQGLKKIAEGREAEMFEWNGGRVLRLYRAGRGLDAAHQAMLLDIARTCGVRVPGSYGTVEIEGRTGIVMERIAGPDLLTQLNAQPWRLLQAGGIWGRTQADINSRTAPPEVEPVHDRLRRMIENSPLVPNDLRAPALTRLSSLPEGTQLLHGDCHPANIMRNGSEFVTIDWSNVTRGPAEADYFRSYLMGTLGDLPPGTPWLIRTFAGFGRRAVRSAFSRAYRRALPPDPGLVNAWRMPIIVARFAEGLEAEFPALDDLARRLLNDKATR